MSLLKFVNFSYEYKGKLYRNLFDVVTEHGIKVTIYKVNDISNRIEKVIIYKLDKNYYVITNYITTYDPCREITLNTGYEGFFSTKIKATNYLLNKINKRIAEYEKYITNLKSDLIKLEE